MAKEKDLSEPGGSGSGEKKKSKKKRDFGTEGDKKRARLKFCPNSSKNVSRSFNKSRTRIEYRISVSTLKKNNEQLAKNLNICKMTIGELKEELVAKERQIQDYITEAATLRAGVDPVLLEAEVARRVAAAISPIQACLTGAVDCLVQTSDHVTRGLQLANQPSRMSSLSNQQLARLSSTAPRHPRQSSIGPSFRMRSAAPEDGAAASPPTNVSKVGPMVAGHAISRPRIQLTRMDEAAMAAARERQAEDLGLVVTPQQQPDMVEEEQEYEELPGSPQHPGRTRFNMTIIGEESRVDDSRMDTTGVLEEEEEGEVESVAPTSLLPLPEEPLNASLNRRMTSSRLSLQPTVRLSPVVLSSDLLEATLSTATPSRYRLSVERGLTPRYSANSTSTTSSTSSSRRSGAMRLSPKPMVEPSSSVRLSLSQPTSPIPSPPTTSQTPISLSTFPENPSESFLEALANDPGEGPSWLFQDKNKKKRSSTARRLSALFSESERESGATSSCVETSDLSINDPENVSADTTDEESRFLLAKDLRGPSGSGIFETAPSTPTTSGFVSPSHINEDMDLTSQQHNMSNKENTENMEESTSVLSVSRSKNRRTPLGEMDLEGERVTYNPKTETGTVANLREAQILLRNVGMQGKRSSGGVTPYRLSDCYVALSPGRCMSLDQLLNLGLMAGQAEDVGPSSGGGRKRRLNGLSEGSKPTTSSPQLSSAKRAKSTSLHGLRDIPKNSAIENASEEETNDEPVPSELQTREELSDNDKPNTELEDVEVLRRLFEESAPQENTAENSGEVSVHEGTAVVDERVESASDAVESDSRCNMVTIEKFSDIYDSPKANDAGSNEDFTTDPSEDTEVITKNIRNRINRASYIESPVIQKPEKCKKSGTRGKSINLGNTNMSTVEKSKGKHKGKNSKSTNSSITNTAMRDENDVSGSSEGLNIPKKSTIASTMKKKSSTAPMKTKDSIETISVETTPESQDKVRGGKNSLQLAPDTSQNDENAGRVKRCRAQISYALPSLNSKLRRDK